MFYHIRLSRNYWLISTYQIAQAKNEETLESLEKMCYHAVEHDKAYIDDHGKYFTSILIDKFTDGLGLSIHNLVLHEDLPDDPSTWNKKIEMLTISNRLYKMIYGDNLMFYHTRLSRNYWLISTYQIAQGKNAETLESLEKMCYHAIEYDKAYINDHGKYFTSILTDKLIYPEPSKDFHECTEHTLCYHILKKTQHPRYDCIRQDPRFVEIVEKLKLYAK